MQQLPIVPGVLKLVLPSINSGARMGTSFHFTYSSSPPSDQQATALADWAVNKWDSHFGIHTPTTTTLGPALVQDLASKNGASIQGSVSRQGSGVGDGVPDNVCVLVNHGIRQRYRGGKPRNYLPLGLESDISSGQEWLETSRSAFQTAFLNWQIDMTLFAGGVTLTTMCAVSYYHDFTVVVDGVTGRARNVPKLRDTPVVYSFTSSTVNPVPGTQRRRLNP